MRNKRFEQLAEEERHRNRHQGPLERSPRQSDDSYDRGPPPIANSRFAAAAARAEEEEQQYHRRRDEERNNLSGPPVANSRFAAVAAEEEQYRQREAPPPVVKSRFAAAAARAEEEAHEEEQMRRERDAFYGQESSDNRRMGAPPQNSRFAAAAAADEDYVSHEERQRRMNEGGRFDDRDGGRFGGREEGGRFGGRDEGGRFGGRDEGGRHGGRDDGGRYGGRDEGGRYGGRDDGGRYGGRDDYDHPYGGDRAFDSRPPGKSSVSDLLKPKAPAATDNVLKPPSQPAPEHEANMLKVPLKPSGDAAMAEEKVEDAKAEEPIAEPEPEPTPGVNTEELLQEFASGQKLGDELKAWCEERRGSLPQVEKLVFHLLMEREKLNPDLECAWAKPSNYGAALAMLVEDDIYSQMQVLWGVQSYCDKLGFPKLNDEYVVQAMFRNMYKYDLADVDAFMAWKEDESDEHDAGKMKSIIQTVEWFNWLEEDDEEEAEEEDFEEEE